MHLPLDALSDKQGEEEVRNEQVADEDSTTPVIADPPWRTVSVLLLSGNTQIAMATCKSYYDCFKETEA